uniref:Uncharacterized protein n=1 Tax=Panagrolaimus davidi TaxID=227884 RepID=A0A914PTX9_9BILA
MKVIDTPSNNGPICHDPLIEKLFGIQIFLETYVSKIRIRCIKYTSNRLLTDNEKVLYKAYEKEIENYAQNDFDKFTIQATVDREHWLN